MKPFSWRTCACRSSCRILSIEKAFGQMRMDVTYTAYKHWYDILFQEHQIFLQQIRIRAVWVLSIIRECCGLIIWLELWKMTATLPVKLDMFERGACSHRSFKNCTPYHVSRSIDYSSSSVSLLFQCVALCSSISALWCGHTSLCRSYSFFRSSIFSVIIEIYISRC